MMKEICARGGMKGGVGWHVEADILGPIAAGETGKNALPHSIGILAVAIDA
jgi:hypothetical protein